MIVLVGHGIGVASVALPTRNANAVGMYANSSHVFTPISVNSTSEGRQQGNPTIQNQGPGVNHNPQVFCALILMICHVGR